MEEEKEVFAITEETLQSKIYYIRGQKVMLDVDLAEIYGYETKGFNRQVKNNIAKFEGDDFMFQLTKSEFDNLRYNFCTANVNNMSRVLPHAFTEQGIYMLMTVLRGELAIKQSRALIRTFKKMKDYILDNRDLIAQREHLQLSMQTTQNTQNISKLQVSIGSIEKQMSDVMNQLSDVVTKSDLSAMMDSFDNEEDNGWLIYNTQYCTADTAYASIYKQAKKSIFVVDNYIGLRTLVQLKNAAQDVEITIFSDNVGYNKLHTIEFNDFCKEYPEIEFSLKKTCCICHDRFIVLDYSTEEERIFLCGASSKDAGARIVSIVEDFGIKKYKPFIDTLLQNPELVLS